MKFPISPKKVLIAIGVLIGLVLNYEEFVADSFRAIPTTTAAHASAPVESQRSLASRSPIERLKESAEIGNVKDQLTLAGKYSTADEVVKNQAEASRWYLMAARGGHVQAMHEVSMRYRYGFGFTKNTAEADVWRQRAASGGHPDAAYAMALVYGTVTDRGAVIAQHKEHDPGDSSRQLVMWLTRASDLGSAIAKHQVAMVRLVGISKHGADRASYLVPLPSVTASAVQLLAENAEAGYWESQYALAELYQTGYANVEANQRESNKWWEHLDVQTDASVQAAIGRHYLVSNPDQYRTSEKRWKGKDLSYDEAKLLAYKWFGRAAAQGNREALWQVAVMEYSGTGTPKNPASALQLHQRAAELGQVDAMYHLGMAYVSGNGVQKDYASALRWLARSVAYEDAYGNNPVRPLAQNAIGGMYENGYGLNSDLVLAYAWYHTASVGGSESAADGLSRLAQLLKPEQVLEAQNLSREWKPGSQISRRIR